MSTKITDYNPNATTAIAKLAGFQQVADLLNLFLSCEAEPSLNDDEVEDATAVFETLCELRPECIKLAQGSAYVVTVKLEENFSELTGKAWVARDEKGNWRCYCARHFAESAGEAVAAMFHSNEIAAVLDDADHWTWTEAVIEGVLRAGIKARRAARQANRASRRAAR